MTADDICAHLAEEGFRAQLSNPSPRSFFISSGHCGLNFNIIILSSDDDPDTRVVSFNVNIDAISLSRINALNEELFVAKAYLNEDGVTVTYRLYLNNDDLTVTAFHSHFIAWLGDIETLSRSIGR